MLPTGYAIRLATREDCPALPAIEREAAKAFVGRPELGASDVDINEATPLERLEAMASEGCLWVVVHEGQPVGFLAAAWHKQDFYIAEVDVHPDHGGNALGKALIETAIAHGFAEGAARITLSTFTEIPWNRPYYERLGFQVVPEVQWTAAMRKGMARQKADGLDISQRCFMARGGAGIGFDPERVPIDSRESS